MTQNTGTQKSDQRSVFRSWMVFCLRLFLTITVLAYLVSIVEFNRVRQILAGVRFEFVWQAFLLLLLNIVTTAVRWSVLLAHLNIRQKVAESWRYYMTGAFYAIMLPGIIGGDAVRLGLSLRRHGKDKAVLATSVFFERACGLMVILMIAAITALLAPGLLREEQALSAWVYGGALAGVCLFVLFFVLLKAVPGKWLQYSGGANNIISAIYRVLKQFRDLPAAILILVLALSFIAHFFDILGSWFLARALHIDQPLVFFLMVIPLVYVLTVLPISLNGLGIREGALAFFLGKVGVPVSDAVLLGFLIYLTRVFVGLAGGAVQYITAADDRPKKER